jgi:hypothetical protein
VERCIEADNRQPSADPHPPDETVPRTGTGPQPPRSDYASVLDGVHATGCSVAEHLHDGEAMVVARALGRGNEAQTLKPDLQGYGIGCRLLDSIDSFS